LQPFKTNDRPINELLVRTTITDFSLIVIKNGYYVEIDEKGTLKVTEHDKYENIAGSV
jgi:hypothetical protein